MRFLVDQAVSWRVANDLTVAGHDAVHVRDLGMSTARDAVILDRAASEDRIIITQDTDFGTLLVASGSERPSVILLRMRSGRPAEQARALLASLTAAEEDLLEGAIVAMSDEAIRVRRLPVP